MNYLCILKKVVLHTANLIKPSQQSQLIIGIYCLGFLLPFHACKSKTGEPAKPPTGEMVFDLDSKHVRDRFNISVQLPLEYTESPDKRYPTVVLTDANFFYPMLAPILHQYEHAGLLPPLILVGIGYGSFEAMDSLRVRDYLYPEALPSDEMETTGGGNSFFHFITEELIPKIDSSFRTNDQRTLLGHSFGGYFSLYALLEQLNQQKGYFNSFISASPTLWYHNRYLFQLPHRLRERKSKDSISLFLSVGGLEDPTWSIKPVKEFYKQLKNNNINYFRSNHLFYDSLDHMDVGLISFMQGLEMIYTEKDTYK